MANPFKSYCCSLHPGVIFLGLAVVFLGSVSQSTQAQDPAKLEQEYKLSILPLLKAACFECHSGAEPEGGLGLNHFESSKSMVKDRRIWEKVIQRLQIGDMPPKEGKPLADENRRKLIEWLSLASTNVDCGRTPNPGSVTLRRMNRLEYRNTIRDLLGITYEPASDFPGDDVGYGFDNIGDVLTLPPLLMEKYLAAAEEISRRAIIAPEPGPVFEVAYRGDKLKLTGSGNTGNGRLNFYSKAHTELQEQAPWAGTYRLEISVSGTQAGSELPKLIVSLDDKKVREIGVKALESKPELLVIPLRLRAGKRTIRLEFDNDFYVEAKDGKSAADRNLSIHDVRLVGQKPGESINPASLPASHRAIVTFQPSSTVTATEAAKKVLQPIASRAFRRPATNEEVDRLVQLALNMQESGNSFEGGIQTALQALLVSPNFLFKVEQPSADLRMGAFPLIDDFEVANRLSYFLWSSMPDDELLKLAWTKNLREPGMLRDQVKRMIADRRANAFVENFAGQWLTLRKLDQFVPNPKMFPKWNDEIRELLRRETYTFFAGVMREDMSVLTLIDGDFTYLNEKLAEYYGVSGVKGDEFRKVSMKGKPRIGLLTHGSILAVTSNPTRTSPVKRGKWILDNLINAPPPPAPPNVPELEKGKLTGTLREQMEQHRANPACSACHKTMDPLGFALENFDAIGLWRTQDQGQPIDASGQLPDGTVVKHAGDLIKNIRNEQSEKFVRCLTEKMMIFAIGRGLEYYDKCAVDDIYAKLKQDNYRFSSLITGIVLSDPFQRRGVKE